MDQAIKQVIVVRKDLNMRKGKIGAQCAHASMKVLMDLMTVDPEPNTLSTRRHYFSFDTEDDSPLYLWLTGIFTKIVVSVDSEQELLDVYRKAQVNDILCSLITDNGLTEFKGIHTRTCVAVGPDLATKIDEITGHLKLL